jgi:ubiquinone/menaquinone biosynthesis C-methylase UbiE
VPLQLQQTRSAFDSVAADYDGDRGNNAAIQDMRTEMWRWLDATFAPGSRLLDLGCGTGLDAARLAQRGWRSTSGLTSCSSSARRVHTTALTPISAH